MTIPDLSQLAAVIDLCRKKNVKAIQVGELRLELGDAPPKREYRKAKTAQEHDPANPFANFPVGELTPEQLTFYSSGGQPENDPFRVES